MGGPLTVTGAGVVYHRFGEWRCLREGTFKVSGKDSDQYERYIK